MEDNYQPSDEHKKYGYGKRPLWQWIIIYIVVGGIAYGLIYYFFFAKSGGYNYAPSEQGGQYKSGY